MEKNQAIFEVQSYSKFSRSKLGLFRSWVVRSWVVRSWVFRSWVVRSSVVRSSVFRSWVVQSWVVRSSVVRSSVGESDGLGLFHSKGFIYTNHVTRGNTVNANYIKDALSKFMKVFKQNRPVIAAGGWWFHWDNAPVHTAAAVIDLMVARQIQVIQHHPAPYFPDLALATSSWLPGWGSWPASPSPRRPSRMNGRGLWELSRRPALQLPPWSGMCTTKSMSISLVATLKS